ncbi:MAG: hypothetical protein NTZ53_07230 [Cyanobacteria bacterium]|nr:hypothetical protein [Cyanobacteriota bacterium]
MEATFVNIAVFKMQAGSGMDLAAFFLSPSGLAVTRAFKGCIQFDVLTEVLIRTRFEFTKNGKARRLGMTTFNSGINLVPWIS